MSRARPDSRLVGRDDGHLTRGHLTDGHLTDGDYAHLAELRLGLRQFLHWSAEQARAAGLTPTQHQLLLAIRASAEPLGPTMGDIAEFLVIRHHSAVGLVDRAQQAELVTRSRDPDHPSIVRLALTESGSARLERLSELHLRELAHLAPTMRALWDSLDRDPAPAPASAPGPGPGPWPAPAPATR